MLDSWTRQDGPSYKGSSKEQSRLKSRIKATFLKDVMNAQMCVTFVVFHKWAVFKLDKFSNL